MSRVNKQQCFEVTMRIRRLATGKKSSTTSNPGVTRMPFTEHLRELRVRLIVSLTAATCFAAAAFALYRPIVSFLFVPFESVEGIGESALFIQTIFEGFLAKVKLSFLIGIIISSPVHLYNVIRFVFPGLITKEKKIISVGLIVSFLLIAGGFYYGYYQIIPLSVRFLTGSGFVPDGVGMLLNYQKNIFYILQFILAFVVAFQTPVMLEMLLAMGAVNRKALLKASRYIVVGIFVFAAVITPPDIVSQASVALPLIVLYFLTIFVARIFRFGES